MTESWELTTCIVFCFHPWMHDAFTDTAWTPSDSKVHFWKWWEALSFQIKKHDSTLKDEGYFRWTVPAVELEIKKIRSPTENCVPPTRRGIPWILICKADIPASEVCMPFWLTGVTAFFSVLLQTQQIYGVGYCLNIVWTHNLLLYLESP